jgi:hypothetical protein
MSSFLSNALGACMHLPGWPLKVGEGIMLEGTEVPAQQLWKGQRQDRLGSQNKPYPSSSAEEA